LIEVKRPAALLLVSMQVAPLVCFAADIKGLKEERKITITDQLAGSPLPGSRPASIWAISFSPDETYIAVGVEFTKKKNHSGPLEADKSYLLIFQTKDPGIVFKKFEIPRHPAMRVYPPLRWSSDSLYIATPFYGDWQHIAVAEIRSEKVTVIDNQHCHLEGLLPGPQVVQRCTSAAPRSLIRFTGPQGETLREWTFPQAISVLGVDSSRASVAVATGGRFEPAPQTHEIVVFDSKDRTEIRHWSLPGGAPYFGSFANSGTTLCAMETSPTPDAADLICWDIESGSESLHQTLPSGQSVSMIGGGKLIGIEHHDIKKVPRLLQSLAQTSIVMTNPTRLIWDSRSARETAELPIRTQWVLPRVDAPYAWTISPVGNFVAEGGTGVVTIYRVVGNPNRP
jgi:hypothetical protein